MTTPTLLAGPFDQFTRFARVELATGDVDPVYPVLEWLTVDRTLEQRIWAVFVHVAYYHLGSALWVLDEHPDPAPIPPRLWKLPTGVERRAHRVPAKLGLHFDHLTELAETHGSLTAWIEAAMTGDAQSDWHTVQNHALMHVRGNGRWASYKTAEMLARVAGLDLEPTDMGHRYSSGPRQGMALLYSWLPRGNSDRDIALLDDLGAELTARLRARDVDATVAEVETFLCDFHSLVEGRYYPGHDIDQMQAQLGHVPGPMTVRAYAARAATLPHAYLGELHDWTGPDRERRRVYRDTLQLVERADATPVGVGEAATRRLPRPA